MSERFAIVLAWVAFLSSTVMQVTGKGDRGLSMLTFSLWCMANAIYARLAAVSLARDPHTRGTDGT